MQYSQSQNIVWATSSEHERGKTEIPNLQIQEIPEEENGEVNEDENSEQTDEDEPIVKEPDKPSVTEGKEEELSTTVMNETNQNETKTLTSELNMLKSVKDPVKKFTMLSEIAEEHGKLPPKTTELLKRFLEGDTTAIGELCNKLSKHPSTNIGQVDCNIPPDGSNDEAIAAVLEWMVLSIMVALTSIITS